MRYMQKLIFAKGAQARHERKVLIGPPSPFTQANIIHEMLNDHANLCRPLYITLSTSGGLGPLMKSFWKGIRPKTTAPPIMVASSYNQFQL